MREQLTEILWQLILEDCTDEKQAIIWKKPILRFADASHPGFDRLRELVTPDHYLPRDYLPGASTVLSWFLPFLPEVGRSNLPGELSSECWINAYNVTNAMAARVNERLADHIRTRLGYAAAVPFDAGMIGPDNPRSRWSQRHAAYLAGHGTFGLNNMLISDAGCVGRYFSVVTCLPQPPDTIVREERCLFKKDGSCGLCVKRCLCGALTEEGFDRFLCLEQCTKNLNRDPGADVCGKCIVELPCSYMDPTAKNKE